MSQPTTEQPPREGGGGLSQKLGPLPAWAWIGIAAVGGIVVILWMRSRNATAAQPATNTVSPDTATVANLQDQLAVVESQIRDLQPGIPGPQGPVGPPGGIGPPGTPPPSGGTQPPAGGGVLHTTVIDGKSLAELLNAFGISQSTFESLNPGIQSTYRYYKPGVGYTSSNTPGSYIALNVGSVPKVVNLPAGTPGGW